MSSRCLVRSLLVMIILVFSMSVKAQESKSKGLPVVEEKQLLQQLLVEVRELRREVRNASLNAYRAQLVIERLKLQQSRVEVLTRQLEENQNELYAIYASKKQLSGKLDDLEADVQT